MTVIRFDLTETEREQKILLTLKEISFNQRGSHSESFGFNIALMELALQGNKNYFLGEFNINLIFQGHYVLKKQRLSQTKENFNHT